MFWRLLFLCIVWTGLAPALLAQGTNSAASSNRVERLVRLSEEQRRSLSFGLNEVEALQEPFFGTPAWQYVSFAIYILLALIVTRLLDWLISTQFKKWASKTETQVDDLLLELGRGPVKVVVFVVMLHIGLQMFTWPNWVEVWLSRGLQIIVALSITYMALKLVDVLMAELRSLRTRRGHKDDKAFDDQLYPIIRKSLKLFVVVASMLVTTQNLGLNITGVLASLSIGGLALGLAAQDTVANLFGAVAIFGDKPFRLGDRVKIGSEVDGTVESIGLRSTRIRSLDGFLITVPNKTMGNAAITNVSRRPTIKTEMNFGLTYETTHERMREAVATLESIYRASPNTADLIVSFNKFGDSALNILVVHWWGGVDYKAYLAQMQEFNLEIKRRFDEAGLDFAFPTQTVIHKPASPPVTPTPKDLLS